MQTLPDTQPSSKVRDNAASAALYATREQRAGKKSPLDKDGKLSSASAATSLKHALPRDLPAYPVVGIANPESSAGAAASLAAANHKNFELWKPDASAPAGKAAILAKDYKAPPQWKPEASDHASAAAMLVKDNKPPPQWKPSMSSAGSKAALLASQGQSSNTPLRKHEPTKKSDMDYDLTQNRASRALQGAAGAVASRKRAGSTPLTSQANTYPDSANSASNALSAATLAHKRPPKKADPYPNDLPGMSLEAAARIHRAATTNMNRDMYTANPPVAPEVEERNRQASLRAAAMTMAKSMYETQQRIQESPEERSDSQSAAAHMHNRRPTTGEKGDAVAGPNQYLHLQETAQKLAAERLAKLNDKDAEYREYYGAKTAPRSRMSLRGRRRSSSADEALETDQQRSQRIRAEMSGLNKRVEDVDAQKRQKDRAALLAAARRNVTKSIHGMDEKVFAETGKASPAMKADWEAKARARAEAESSARLANHGKVAIGGGKYLDQSEVDAIAAARVQPTLDEISRQAEEHRARDEALRRKIEERKELEELKKADDKERDAKTDEDWKIYKGEEKQEKQKKKEEEKARQAELKRKQDENLKYAKEQQAKRDAETTQKAKENRKSKGSGWMGLGAVIGLVGEKEKDKPKTDATQAEAVPATEGSTSLESTKPEVNSSTESPPSAVEKEPLSKTAPKSKQGEVGEAKDEALPYYPAPTTETVISGGQTPEPATQESQKKSSWFRRFSRHGNKPTKAEDPSKKTTKVEEAVDKPTKPTEPPNAPTTEAVATLHADTAENVPVVETDDKPQVKNSNVPEVEAVETAAKEDKEESQAKEDTITIEPVTGLPMDTSKPNPGFGTDEIPHIQPPEEEDGRGEEATAATTAAAATNVPVISSTSEAEPLGSTSSTGAAPPGPIPFTDITQSESAHLPNSSEHDVAMAGKTTALASHPPRSRSTSISSISSDEPPVVLGETGARGRVSGLKKGTIETGGVVDGKEGPNEEEEFQEARDEFNAEEELGKPNPGFASERKAEKSPARETRFKEEL